MSSFLIDLWESIFTPGPTPTILKATNATFAALQLVLLLLLIGTYSIHFVVLSFLCAGLWWSINWFAAEVVAVQERQKAEDALAAKAKKQAASSDESDTEVEEQSVGKTQGAFSAGNEAIEPQGQMRHRVEPQSSASTEDEWEKVSEGDKEKDK